MDLMIGGLSLLMQSFNWVAIFLATFVYFILGGLWFAPFAFLKSWHNAIGFVQPKDWKPDAKYYVGPLLGCFITTLATASFVKMLRVVTFQEAIIVGLLLGVGYAASISFVNAITPTTPRPFLLGFITGSYHVLSIILVALILVWLH